MNEKLYQAIMERKAVRHYQKQPLTPAQHQTVQALTAQIQPLKKTRQAQFTWMDTSETADIVASMGGYGRILNAPHFVIPSIPTGKCALLELGYQSQQWVNLITMHGIASSYIGTLHRGNQKVTQTFEIPANQEFAAAILFGGDKQASPNNSLPKIRKTPRVSPRKKLEQIFYRVDLDTPAIPEDPNWLKILHAARRAPSAGNAQPWRMIILEDELTIYADPQSYIPLLRNVGKTYAIHDVGILMANITQACQSIDWHCEWKVFENITEESLVFGDWTAVSKAKITAKNTPSNTNQQYDNE